MEEEEDITPNPRGLYAWGLDNNYDEWGNHTTTCTSEESKMLLRIFSNQKKKKGKKTKSFPFALL